MTTFYFINPKTRKIHKTRYGGCRNYLGQSVNLMKIAILLENRRKIKIIVGGDIINDCFEGDGVKCATYGTHVNEFLSLSMPSERSTFTNVPAKPGKAEYN